MIVEFKYDQSAEGAWRWKPLRVRHDKTKQTNGLCDGGFNYNRKPRESFGNDFTTANNNWYSIHNPITAEMLSTGRGIPDMTADEGVYYSRKTKETNTRALRDFHNLYVKNKLIRGASHQADKLIDFAVGKAGDLSKWRSAGLDFVFGIDISKDNIFNNKDGACARYLSDAAKFRNMPGAIFLHGNSALNIRSGEAFEGYKEQNIARALFGGEGNAKRNSEIGKMVGKYTGIVGEGFNVSSCQFALHYFFENVHTMHNFMRNVSECTRIG